jgi:F-type H+-transporting ATPase subunit b
VTPAFLAAAGPWQTFFVQVMAFLVVLWVLAKFVRPALGRLLEERSQSVAKTFQDLESELAETSKQLAGIRARIADAEKESARRLQASLDEAAKLRERALSDASQQGQNELEKARQAVLIERDKALLDLRQATTALTLQAAEHLARAAMTEDLNARMVDKYLADFDSVKRT